MSKILTRDTFRRLILTRNNGNCVVPECALPAVDAHHILNRRLFKQPEEFGGYFVENGAGLCSHHHMAAEFTIISTRDLYLFCGINEPCIPAHLSKENEYDTWGNVVVNEYSRVKGELFDDEGCQKALRAGSVLWHFQQVA